MKTLFAGIMIAATMALAIPTPASAIGIYVGPRGGVRVGLGRPYGHRWHRPFVGRRYYGRRVWRRW